MIRIILMLMACSMLGASCSHKYYIVRHAEKEATSGAANTKNNNPSLSEAGKVRALVLREELKDKHISYIYSTNTARTISTATPLSEASGVKIQLYNSTDSLKEFIAKLKSIKKGNVLIVGHSNTVDDIINQLCNEVKLSADLPESQYDNLFIITYKGKKVSFKRSKYGYPSNPE
ncbi:MAG: histidine phosphatase family protein [Bacteroidota bacterium]